MQFSKSLEKSENFESFKKRKAYHLRFTIVVSLASGKFTAKITIHPKTRLKLFVSILQRISAPSRFKIYESNGAKF